MVFREMEAALAAVDKLNNITLASVDQLRKGGAYYVRIKARLKEAWHRLVPDFFAIINSFPDQETDRVPHRLVF